MNHFKSGLLYTAIGKYGYLLFQFILTAILGRLISVADFGKVAIIQVFIVLINVLIESGMGPAIIQNKSLQKEDYQSLLGFSLTLASVFAILFGFFGIFLSWFYSDSIYLTLTWVMSISIFFSGLSIVPTAVLNKAKRFKTVNFTMLTSSFIGGTTGIILAFNHFGIYALLINTICFSTLTFTLNYSFSKVGMIKRPSMVVIRKILGFSSRHFTYNFVNYIALNGDNFLIGKFLGDQALGNYNISYQLLQMPATLLGGVFSPVLQPILSEYQDNVEFIKSLYLKLVHILLLIALPLSVFLSSSANDIIVFIYGSRWINAVFPFAVLSTMAWTQVVLASSAAFYLSRNRPDLLLNVGIKGTIILILAVVIGLSTDSLNNTAIAISTGMLVSFLVSTEILVHKVLQGKLKDVAKEAIPGIIASLAVLVVMVLVASLPITSIFVQLLIKGGAFVLILGGFILLTNEKNIILELFKSKDHEGR